MLFIGGGVGYFPFGFHCFPMVGLASPRCHFLNGGACLPFVFTWRGMVPPCFQSFSPLWHGPPLFCNVLTVVGVDWFPIVFNCFFFEGGLWFPFVMHWQWWRWAAFPLFFVCFVFVGGSWFRFVIRAPSMACHGFPMLLSALSVVGCAVFHLVSSFAMVGHGSPL